MRNVMLIASMLLIVIAVAASGGAAIPLENSPAMGPENAPVTIIEFIDFQ